MQQILQSAMKKNFFSFGFCFFCEWRRKWSRLLVILDQVLTLGPAARGNYFAQVFLGN